MPKSEGLTAQEVWEYITRTLSAPFAPYLLKASDTVVASADTERSSDVTYNLLVKSFHVDKPGRVRLYYDYKIGGPGDNALTEIYVQNVLAGGGLTASTTYVTTYLDLSVGEGSIIDIYLKVQNGVRTAYIQNARICYTLDTSQNIVILD